MRMAVTPALLGIVGILWSGPNATPAITEGDAVPARGHAIRSGGDVSPTVIVRNTEDPRLQDYTITGIEAWSTARQYGFQFRPVARDRSERVTRPYDGVNTQLLGITGLLQSDVRAAVVGGNAVVYKPRSGTYTRTIRFFWGRQLASGWRVIDLDVTGTRWAYSRQPGWETADIPFSLSVTATTTTTGSARVRSLTLRGPRNADWRRAFRRD